MKGSGSRLAPSAWKSLMFLSQNQKSIKLKDLCREINLSEEETLALLRQFFPAGSGTQIYQENNECWVKIDTSSLQYMLPLSPSEWIELHHLLSREDENNNPGLMSLKKKVSEDGPVKMVMELLDQLQLWEHQLNDAQLEIVKQLDLAIENKKPVEVSLYEGRKCAVFPCKVVHLEGQLSLICEEFDDHCLMIISVKQIQLIQLKESTRQSRVSYFEIEEFIAAVRAMNDKETRLILKIHDPQSVNLFPDYQFLGKPCMITNSNGDLIWAAYVEACEPLYEWLLSLGSNVEILDPNKFKADYLSYCEAKLRKIA